MRICPAVGTVELCRLRAWEDERPSPPWLFDVSERQWLALDVAAAVFVFFSAGLALRAPVGHKSPADLALVLVCSLGVAARRRWPIPAMAVVTLSFAALANLGGAPLALSGALALVGYMVSAREPRTLSIRALVVAEAVLAAAIGIVGSGGAVGQEAIQSLLVLAAAWFVGDSVSARRAYVVSAAEQERAAESVRARQAVREERVRIARELHDVVAHSLAVITVQAGVGRRLMDKRPEEAGAALESIEATGRTAQDELRVVLGLLREDDAERAELMPAPQLADLEELIETVRAAGTPVSLRTSGTDRRLSPALQLSVYRIVQEALTNVVKHAAGGAGDGGRGRLRPGDQHRSRRRRRLRPQSQPRCEGRRHRSAGVQSRDRRHARTRRRLRRHSRGQVGARARL